MPATEPTYYEIISKALYDGKIMVMGASTVSDDGNVYVQAKVGWENPDKDLQLWERRPRAAGGYALVNKRRGTCIVRRSNENGTALELGSAETIAINDLAGWRDDNVEGTYNAINSWLDWEQKINIPGNSPTPGQTLISYEWDGGDDNELWNFQQNVAKIEMLGIVFEIDKGRLEDQTPVVASAQTLVNATDVEQEQKVTFRFLEAHKYSFSYERGFKITGSIETTAKVPLVGEAKVKIQVETSFKWTTDSESSDEQEVAVEIPVKVPARTAVEVEAILLNARLDVPYRADLKLTYWDGQPKTDHTFGVFTGVNAYNVITRFNQSPLAHRQVLRKVRKVTRFKGADGTR